MNYNTGQNKLVVDGSNPALYYLQVPTGFGLHKLIKILDESPFSEESDLELTLAQNTGIDLYVDGVKKLGSIDYIYNKTASPEPTITFTSGIYQKRAKR